MTPALSTTAPPWLSPAPIVALIHSLDSRVSAAEQHSGLSALVAQRVSEGEPNRVNGVRVQWRLARNCANSIRSKKLSHIPSSVCVTVLVTVPRASRVFSVSPWMIRNSHAPIDRRACKCEAIAAFENSESARAHASRPFECVAPRVAAFDAARDRASAARLQVIDGLAQTIAAMRGRLQQHAVRERLDHARCAASRRLCNARCRRCVAVAQSSARERSAWKLLCCIKRPWSRCRAIVFACNSSCHEPRRRNCCSSTRCWARSSRLRHVRDRCFRRYSSEAALRKRDFVAAGPQKTQLQRIHALFHSMLHRGQQLRRGGGSGRTQVGNEIGDGEVRLMSDSGDHGNCRPGDRAGEQFGVERGKVLRRAATARDDDGIDVHRAIEIKNAGSDFASRLLALHGGGIEQHIETGVPPLGDVEEIVNDGAGEAM